MIKLDSKKQIGSLIAVGVALMNFVALAFTLVRGIFEMISGSEEFFANGYKLAFVGYPTEIDSMGEWLVVYSQFYFIVSVLIVIALGISFFMKKELDFGKLGIASSIVSCVMVLGYMLNGIAINAEVSEYGSLNFTHYTLAFIPAIIIFAAAGAQFYIAIQNKSE